MQGHGNQIALFLILCAGDDLKRLCAAHIDLADPHMIGVLMADHGDDFTDHDILNCIGEPFGGLHFGAGERHGLGKLMVSAVHIHKLSQPFSRKIHRFALLFQNCSRNRTSLSKIRRRSEILNRRMVMRSMPMPKAKPE